MIVDTVVFYSSLFICISLGSYYKKIDNNEMKRNYGAGLGLLVACILCGKYVYHSVLLVWGNTIIIKCCDKRYVHAVSLAYTWFYLTYLHYNHMSSQYEVWFHQTLALRLVGLAFEVYITERAKPESTFKRPSTSLLLSSLKLPTATEMDVLDQDPTAIDIITYSYFFIGIHKGPYYRWKSFDDHFNAPFGVLGDCRLITVKKLKKAFVCGMGYLLLRLLYDTDIYNDDEFYTSYGSDSRYLHGLPFLVMYFLRNQMIMMLCTSVCTETGFGVYPAKTNPLPGHGPSTGIDLLKLASSAPDVALEQEYNFSMLKCYDFKKLVVGPRMRGTVRAWDMPTRYWFWSYTYKNFLRANKEVRGAFSFLMWTVWRGASAQQLIVSATTWVYVSLEAEYDSLYDTSGSMKMSWDIGFGIMRFLYLIYLTPCLVINDTKKVLRFYNSIFWVYHVLLLALMVLNVIVAKSKQQQEQTNLGRTTSIGNTNALSSPSLQNVKSLQNIKNADTSGPMKQ